MVVGLCSDGFALDFAGFVEQGEDVFRMYGEGDALPWAAPGPQGLRGFHPSPDDGPVPAEQCGDLGDARPPFLVDGGVRRFGAQARFDGGWVVVSLRAGHALILSSPACGDHSGRCIRCAIFQFSSVIQLSVSVASVVLVVRWKA